MGYVPLGGEEETHVVFAEDIPDHLDESSAAEQRDVFKKLHDIASSEAPPEAFVHERIRNIDILKFSSKGRIYAKIVTGIPKGNTHYHIVYVLYIDEDHEYDQSDLSRYSVEAQERLERITSLSGLEDVDRFLDERDSLDAENLAELLG